MANRFRIEFEDGATRTVNANIVDLCVEEIEILDLDEGSDNSGNNDPKGMIHGKEYSLQVKKFKNDKEPKNENIINWSYGHPSDDGGVVVGEIKQKGKKITFKTDDLNLCGKEITFYAYISDKDKEGELDVFHHYRFRWFDRKVVENQINNRKINPWLIDQGATSLCGMACIFYLLVKNDANGYEKLAKDLHKKGKTKYNDYIIEPNKSSLKMYDTNPYKSKDHPSMPEIDWITMAVTRSKESDFGYTGKKGQDASAINWPWLMTNLGKKLLGYKTVKMDYYKINKSYIRDFFGSDEKIRILEKDIDVDYQNGYEICMMIDGDMVNNKADYDITDLGEYHWIVYEGGLNMSSSKNNPETDYDEIETINFKSFTWGEKVLTSRTSKGISKKAYRNNYYGYIKFK